MCEIRCVRVILFFCLLYLTFISFLFTVFLLAVHHRATGCPNEFPRKLVRTTVSNDHAPEEGPLVGASSTDPSAVWDLSLDRVNAEASPVHEEL